MTPGQPPWSRWSAQIDRKFIRCARAKRIIAAASRSVGDLGLLRVVVDAGQHRHPLEVPDPRRRCRLREHACSWRCAFVTASIARWPMRSGFGSLAR